MSRYFEEKAWRRRRRTDGWVMVTTRTSKDRAKELMFDTLARSASRGIYVDVRIVRIPAGHLVWPNGTYEVQRRQRTQ